MHYKRNNYLAGFGYNAIKQPASDVKANATLIPATTGTITTLKKPTSDYLMMNIESGVTGNYISLVNPMKYLNTGTGAESVSGATALSGGVYAFGCFAALNNSANSDVNINANRFKAVEIGFDDRWDTKSAWESTACGVGNPNCFIRGYPKALSDCWVSYISNVNTQLQGAAGLDLSITIPSGNFYMTGMVVERLTTGNWWCPQIIVVPSTNAFPYAGGTFKVRMDMPGYGSANICAASAVRVRVYGFMNPPCPLTKVDIAMPALANTRGNYKTVSATMPANFKFLGAYMVGLNSGNYFARPWAFINTDPHARGNTKLEVIICNMDSPITAASAAGGCSWNGVTNGVAATDLVIRCVGIIA